MSLISLGKRIFYQNEFHTLSSCEDSLIMIALCLYLCSSDFSSPKLSLSVQIAADHVEGCNVAANSCPSVQVHSAILHEGPHIVPAVRVGREQSGSTNTDEGCQTEHLHYSGCFVGAEVGKMQHTEHFGGQVKSGELSRAKVNRQGFFVTDRKFHKLRY